MSVDLSPAIVLRRAADWLAEDPKRWGKGFFVGHSGGRRCAAGAVCYVIDPADPDGNPTNLRDRDMTELGEYTVDVLAHYLADYRGTPLCDDPIDTVANYNDENATAETVIAAMRGAADEYDAQQAAHQARAS